MFQHILKSPMWEIMCGQAKSYRRILFSCEKNDVATGWHDDWKMRLLCKAVCLLPSPEPV